MQDRKHSGGCNIFYALKTGKWEQLMTRLLMTLLKLHRNLVYKLVQCDYYTLCSIDMSNELLGLNYNALITLKWNGWSFSQHVVFLNLKIYT